MHSAQIVRKAPMQTQVLQRRLSSLHQGETVKSLCYFTTTVCSDKHTHVLVVIHTYDLSACAALTLFTTTHDAEDALTKTPSLCTSVCVLSDPFLFGTHDHKHANGRIHTYACTRTNTDTQAYVVCVFTNGVCVFGVITMRSHPCIAVFLLRCEPFL